MNLSESLSTTVMECSLVSSSSSSSSSSSAAPRWLYDVFLSFYGKDTRNNFVDHLYAALEQIGINTFKDDEKLHKGKTVSLELDNAIEESKVAVVVFSKNYANSSWCLDELTKIIECQNLTGQRVLPVFYDVDPSDVRGQKGSFETAFKKYEVELIHDEEKVERWRHALVAVANLSGWDVSRTANGREAECIKSIVRNILCYTEYQAAENLIGMESRVQHVKSLLGKGSVDVCMIGIWGMGGIGKTTIARAVCRQISNEFEGYSFLEDVRENGSDKKGLKSLQKKLLSEILLLLKKDLIFRDCDDGICEIRTRLGGKKVLVVLDDVDNFKQLQFLAGAHEWFGPGSRIIITTRDEHLLSYAQQKYAPELLRETDAVKLFSRYAFNANIPPKEYEKQSSVVVRHTGHLPLALNVLGSHFCGRNLEFWDSAIKVLAKIPHKEINGILKLSYDGLNAFEKKIFLHIACFFKGRKRHKVTRILNSLCLEALSGITVLIEKSLLTISDGYIHMHDLIQEMGWSIVREFYPNNMVWLSKEIKEVMARIERLETVEAIVDPEFMNLSSAEVLKSMKKLSLLEVKWQLIGSEHACFPEELRWLSWSYYPCQTMIITRSMTNLVGLKMKQGKMKELQIEKKIILANLKFMDLRHSWSITTFPDISGVPNLERLNLSGCSELVDVHQSVLLHDRIIHLDLSSCVSLNILPPSIHMTSLQTLRLNGCKSLEKFPQVLEEMGRLLLLDIKDCHMIRELKSSIRLLTGLTILTVEKNKFNLSGNSMERFCILGLTFLSSLRILELQGLDLVDDEFPWDLHIAWTSLEELHLNNNMFTLLPTSICQLSHLKYLNLRNCRKLKELTQLPKMIQVLNADMCKSLEKIGDITKKYKWLFQISFYECCKLSRDKESSSHLANMFMKSWVQKCAAVNHRLSIEVPGKNIPNWFSNQRMGNTIDLNLPKTQITKMIGLAICCIFGPYDTETTTNLFIKLKPSDKENVIDSRALGPKWYHRWLGYMSVELIGDVCRGSMYDDLVLRFHTPRRIMKCGVCVVYKDDIKSVSAGNRSWIPDYDELGLFDIESASANDVPHGRLSLPTFSFQHEKTGHSNIVDVRTYV